MSLTAPIDTASPSLDLPRSVTGKRWVLREYDERAVDTLCQRLQLDRSLAEVLSSRGVTLDEAPSFLAPSLRDSLPDPDCLTDMKKAVARLVSAIETGETIGIFGDYDVDGTTSAALLVRYFTALDVSHIVHIPDRIAEGYGPNAQAFRSLKEKGASVCVTVDCGAMAHDIIDEAQSGGLDIVVTDHHQMTLPAPPAIATVNPNRPDDISGLGNLSAAGVTFMLLVGLNRALRQQGYFADKAEPKLLQWLDLVALGLMCDVMPLTGLTRVLVAQGLKVMGAFGEGQEAPSAYPGLFSLAAAAGASGKASAYHLGFVLGPRINAAGRIGHARQALQLMTANSLSETVPIAEELNRLNGARQDIEGAVLTDAIAQVEARRLNAAPSLVVTADDGWHPGVIGIVAGRLKERFDCPAITIGFEGDIGKGSGRSITGVDLGAAIAAANREGLLISGGGHAMAAGLTIERDKLEAFTRFLEERLSADIETARAAAALNIDSTASLALVTKTFCDCVAAAGPFGPGNAEPRFAFENVRVRYADIKGTNHVACTFTDSMGRTARAIAFRCAEEPLGHALLNAGPNRLHVAGKIREDSWRGGDAAQIHIEDVTLAAS